MSLPGFSVPTGSGDAGCPFAPAAGSWSLTAVRTPLKRLGLSGQSFPF